MKDFTAGLRFILTLPVTFPLVLFAACLPIDNKVADWLFGIAISISGIKKED